MSMEEMELCLERGAKITDMIHADGCNVVSFGEMGIGNTSPSSIWMHLLTGISLEQCVGAGSGLDSEGIRHKYNVLKQSVNHYTGNGSVKDIIMKSQLLQNGLHIFPIIIYIKFIAVSPDI